MILVFGGKDELKVSEYSDVSFQTDLYNNYLQYSWVLPLVGGMVNWRTSKQQTMVDSTCELAYIKASKAAK